MIVASHTPDLRQPPVCPGCGRPMRNTATQRWDCNHTDTPPPSEDLPAAVPTYELLRLP